MKNKSLFFLLFYCGCFYSQTNAILNSTSPIIFNSFGSGTYNHTEFYHSLDGLKIELAKNQNDYNSTPIDFKISARGGERSFFKINGSTGNISIGTYEGSSRLEIYNDAASGHLVLSANDNPGNDFTRIDLDYKIKNSNSTIARISSKFHDSANGGSGGLYFYTSQAGSLLPKLVIQPNGNASLQGNFETKGILSSSTPSNEGGRLSLFNPAKTGDQADNWSIYNMTGHYGNSLQFWNYTPSGLHGAKLIISDAGNMSLPQGKFEAKEVKVTTTPTADFVFEEDYKLPTLEEVERYIKAKKHLPEIASAKEMKKEGVNLGEFQIKLLQKIEELTLYSIEQNRQIKEQNIEISNLKNEIGQIRKQK